MILDEYIEPIKYVKERNTHQRKTQHRNEKIRNLLINLESTISFVENCV